MTRETKKERWWRLAKYPRLYMSALHVCQQRGHMMVHASNWRWRRNGINEKFWCRHCQMELYIQMTPYQEGYDHVHGVAFHVNCTYNAHKDAIINSPEDIDAEGDC